MLTPEQKELRKTGIGGSDVAAIAGISPYDNATPLQIYLTKIGEIENNIDNEATRWGHIHEPNVAEQYAIKTGKELTIPTQMYRHPVHSFMIANPDRLIKNDKAILECKTAGFRQKDKWGKEGTSQIPDVYYLQVAHYAIVCEVEYVDIAVLIDTNDHRIYRYHRKEKIEDKLIEIERNFWENHVIPRVPPLPINRRDSQLRWPLSLEQSSKQIDQNHQVLLDQLSTIHKQIEQLSKTENQLKNRLCTFMEDSEALIDEQGNYLVTWKSNDRAVLDLKRFKVENPALYEKYSITKSVRPLRISKLEEEK